MPLDKFLDKDTMDVGQKLLHELNRVVVPAEVELGLDLGLRSKAIYLVGTGPMCMKNIFDNIAGEDTRTYGEFEWSKETYQRLEGVGLAVDKNIDQLLTAANIFRKRPSLGNFTQFLDVAPRAIIGETQLTVKDNVLEDKLDPKSLVALSAAGVHMQWLRCGSRRLQATASTKADQTTYTLYFANQGKGVRSETNMIHHDDEDVGGGAVLWKNFPTMLANSVRYQGLDNGLLAKIITDQDNGKIVSARMEWVATVVPSGNISNLEWGSHPSGNPTK